METKEGEEEEFAVAEEEEMKNNHHTVDLSIPASISLF